MSTAPIETLPEELVLTIFEHLDSQLPSKLKSRDEPSLQLTTSHTQTYKHISQVSKRWRRIVLPLLFRYSRLRLDITPKPEWSECQVCGREGHQRGNAEVSPGIDTYHAALYDQAIEFLETSTYVIGSPETELRSESLQWAGRFYHSLKDFLQFVSNNKLSSSVQSFVLSTDSMMPKQDRFPHRMASNQDYRYRASAAFWHGLLSEINVSRVVIVASPADLACLTNCAIDLFGDWAFADMEYHILELSIDGNGSAELAQRSNGSVGMETLQYVPAEYPGIAGSSILKLRPWSHLSLNEGSFLKAYGTYEYFERGPPSLIYSIKDCLASRRLNSKASIRGGTQLRALRSFTYTAILPFANHLDIRGLLPFIEELDIKLAPDPESGILSDKDRVGKAELEDCWQELFTAYRLITKPFRTHEIRSDGTPRLKKFVCRDVKVRALADELDDEFTPLCLPVWAEMEPGVFVRLIDVPPVYELEDNWA